MSLSHNVFYTKEETEKKEAIETLNCILDMVEKVLRLKPLFGKNSVQYIRYLLQHKNPSKKKRLSKVIGDFDDLLKRNNDFGEFTLSEIQTFVENELSKVSFL